MALTGLCALSRLLCLMLLFDLRSHMCEAVVADVQNAMFHSGRCIWATHGGNMTSAEDACEESGGSVITLNISDTGTIILNSLNISNDTPFYVKIVSDWLIQPEDVTRDETSNICVKLLNEEFVAENCTVELPVTICESYELSHCDKIYPVNRLELETETSAQTTTDITRIPATLTQTQQPSTMTTTTLSSLPRSTTLITAKTLSASSSTKPTSTTSEAPSSTLTPPSTSSSQSITQLYTTPLSTTTATPLSTTTATPLSTTTATPLSTTTATPLSTIATTPLSTTTATPLSTTTATPLSTTTATPLSTTTATPLSTIATTPLSTTTATPLSTTTATVLSTTAATPLWTTTAIPLSTPLSTTTATLLSTTTATVLSTTAATSTTTSITTPSSLKGTTSQIPPFRSTTTHGQNGTTETVTTERLKELSELAGILLTHDVPLDSLNTSSSNDTSTESMSSNGACNSSVHDDHQAVYNSTHSTAPTTVNSQVVNPSEILQIPDGNGTRNVSWGNFVFELLEKVNVSETIETTTEVAPHNVTIATPEVPQHNATHTNHSGPPVTEVKFQVSGMNNGSVRPWTGSPPHHMPQPRVHNISKVLNALKQEQTADNKTLKVFAITVSIVGTDAHIATETDAVKTTILDDVLNVGEHLMAKIPVSMKTVVMTTNEIDLESKILASDEADNNTMVAFRSVHEKNNIQLSKSIFESCESKDIRVSALTYKKIDTVLKASNKHISSNVVSVTIHYLHDNISETGVIKINNAIYFEMETEVDGNKHEEERLCSFWDVHERKWSTTGCDVVAKNTTHTCCQCHHLTSFAILVMYMETQDISVQSQQALFTMTTVGCSLSIACLVMALICYIYLRMLTNEKIMIHANLSVALLLAQIVFVSSSDAHKDPIACKVVAVLLHFLFMATFTWMMVEGIALYLCCTKGIFQHRDMRTKYFLLGWGLPVVIVVISMAARFPNYGTGPQYSCWLSVKDGLIWAFLAPMLIIVLMNIGVMGLVVKVFLTLRANADKTEVARLRGSLRAMLTLLPLLGVTWIFSLLVPFSVVFHYFFVITNTVQGMCIFFLHCICNEQIRKKFYEKRRKWSTTRTGSDADMTFPTRRKTGSFDAIRAAAPTTATTIPADNKNRMGITP